MPSKDINNHPEGAEEMNFFWLLYARCDQNVSFILIITLICVLLSISFVALQRFGVTFVLKALYE